VLSRSNTDAEMERKRNEYFDAGVALVWLVDHRTRTVQVYNDVENHVTLHEDDTLDGGTVLPEFRVPVNELFADLS
jgi:Uma2 family endonuclease